MFESLMLISVGLAVCLGVRLYTAATADAAVDRYTTEHMREYGVLAGETIYKGSYVGLSPSGYAKAFEGGDKFIGIAYEQVDCSAETSDNQDQVRVYVRGTFSLTLASVAITDIGKAVYATDSGTLALSGNADGFIGRVIDAPATNTAAIEMKKPGEMPGPDDFGSYELSSDFVGVFEASGAASATKYHATGFTATGTLGLGVHQIAGEDGGAQLDFDAVAEVANAVLYSPDVFPVDKGIRLEARLYLSDIGDAAALDVDWGLGTLLTANSRANIDHAEMVNLACFHLDGSSANILAQSDDDTTDVAPVDTTIDNALDTAKEFVILVRPTGAVEFWIDGARVLSTTTFAVGATAALCAFINLEKTSDDTTAVMVVDRIRVTGGRA
jgi:hypothetical protein